MFSDGDSTLTIQIVRRLDTLRVKAFRGVDPAFKVRIEPGSEVVYIPLGLLPTVITTMNEMASMSIPESSKNVAPPESAYVPQVPADKLEIAVRKVLRMMADDDYDDIYRRAAAFALGIEVGEVEAHSWIAVKAAFVPYVLNETRSFDKLALLVRRLKGETD